MNTFSHVPPGFRFHPTDEELVDYYLRKKIASKRIDLDVIKDIDLYKIEPWDLQELCNIGHEDQNEWYFFSHKDKKYPTGTRTNRATKVGFWKATGRDKAIYLRHSLIGMRKTLVFYKGRAPNGQKSDWIMHEYRLETNENGTPQEEGWVVCRVFKKRLPNVRKIEDYESPCWYDDQVSLMPQLETPTRITQPYGAYLRHCKQQPEFLYSHDPFLQLPHLESSKASSIAAYATSTLTHQQYHDGEPAVDQVTDWRVLDKFVASQLSHEDASKETNDYSNAAFHAQMNVLENESKRPDFEQEYASTPASSCQIDPWK